MEGCGGRRRRVGREGEKEGRVHIYIGMSECRFWGARVCACVPSLCVCIYRSERSERKAKEKRGKRETSTSNFNYKQHEKMEEQKGEASEGAE